MTILTTANNDLMHSASLFYSIILVMLIWLPCILTVLVYHLFTRKK